MKTLKKLLVNPEKLIKNEELVNLRGGYGGGCSPGPVGESYWKCCVDGTPYTYYKDNAADAETVCEQNHGVGKCDCEEV